LNTKFYVILFAGVFMATICSYAQKDSIGTPQPLPKKLELKSDQLTFIVEPAVGGRIASLQFVGIELLSQTRDNDNLQWGSTVWPSPQSDWNWPPPEKMDQWPYKVISASDKLIVLESAVDAYQGLKVSKRFELVEDDAIDITYAFLNRAEDTVQVGIWENTRIPYAGTVRWTTPENDTMTYQGLTKKGKTSHLELKGHEKPYKFFIRSEGGWLAYYYQDVIFSKKFPVIKSERIAPDQAQIEVYIDPEKGFAELEEHGPYVQIAPGAQTRFKVKWKLSKNKKVTKMD